jgi:hypothetical protein
MALQQVSKMLDILALAREVPNPNGNNFYHFQRPSRDTMQNFALEEKTCGGKTIPRKTFQGLAWLHLYFSTTHIPLIEEYLKWSSVKYL